eukprot:2275476-Rhodomonas_salina.4
MTPPTGDCNRPRRAAASEACCDSVGEEHPSLRGKGGVSLPVLRIRYAMSGPDKCCCCQAYGMIGAWRNVLPEVCGFSPAEKGAVHAERSAIYGGNSTIDGDDADNNGDKQSH